MGVISFTKGNQKTLENNIQKTIRATKSSGKMDDFELVRTYLATQESRYFSTIYDRYNNKVYAKCISLLRNEALAQDALQDIFMKIFLNLAKFNEKSKFSTWIYSITYNYCIDIIRRKKKEKKIFSDDLENTPDPVEDVPDESLLEMEIEKLKVVLDRIPIGDKAILLMKYQDEMKIKEIGESMAKTESAIKMKIKRAKHKVQKVYHEIYNNK